MAPSSFAFSMNDMGFEAPDSLLKHLAVKAGASMLDDRSAAWDRKLGRAAAFERGKNGRKVRADGKGKRFGYMISTSNKFCSCKIAKMHAARARNTTGACDEEPREGHASGKVAEAGPDSGLQLDEALFYNR